MDSISRSRSGSSELLKEIVQFFCHGLANGEGVCVVIGDCFHCMAKEA